LWVFRRNCGSDLVISLHTAMQKEGRFVCTSRCTSTDDSPIPAERLPSSLRYAVACRRDMRLGECEEERRAVPALPLLVHLLVHANLSPSKPQTSRHEIFPHLRSTNYPSKVTEYARSHTPPLQVSPTDSSEEPFKKYPIHPSETPEWNPI
jgi:hypothetical protein